MSLITTVVLPLVEKQLIAMEPEFASFLVSSTESLMKALLNWIDIKAKPAAAKEPEK